MPTVPLQPFPQLPPAAQWQRMSSVLDELLELDSTARAQRLEAERAVDPQQAAALERLLAPLTRIDAGGFLDEPAALPDAGLAGQRIGPYLVERELGRGGMGSVWLARRADGRYDGQVAIKFVLLGLSSATARERFQREGRILARLSHPHIAGLIDAGTAGGGNLPYLVLEYVDGEPIDVHCRRAALDTRATLALMLDVLDAVAHAHARLTLHRDLKPSNILVAGGAGVKLLDFGIAKLLDDGTRPAQATALTEAAGRVCTPLYAAPEQMQGGDMTTATDVYALGGLLYLLLTGSHATSTPDAPALEQMRAAIADTPPRMSDRAPPQQRGMLRGDLDLIVAKALKKQPAQRYANAAELADDLRRWLAGAPILARPDARAYRLRKFVQRHRLVVAAGSTAVLALTAGAVIAAWQAVEADRQRLHAEGLVEYMLGDLRSRLQPVGRLDVLDGVGARALAYYAAQDQRRLNADALGRRARALRLIGEMAELRGNLPEAERVFRQSADSTGELLARSPDDGQRVFDHAQSVFWVAYMAWRQGGLGSAERGFRDYEALAQRLVALDASRADWRAEVAQAQVNLGTVLLEAGRLQQAHVRLLQASRDLPALVAERPALAEDLANALGWLARAEGRLGRIGDAIRSLESLVALRAPQASASPPDWRAVASMATAHSQQSALELLRGNATAATAQARQALQLQRTMATQEPDNLLWQQELAWTRLRLAEALLHNDTLAARTELAQVQTIGERLQRQAPDGSAWNLHLQGQTRLLAALLAPAAGERPLAAWLAALPAEPGDAGLRDITLRARLLLGDTAAARGDHRQAALQWQAAAVAGPQDPDGASPEPLLAIGQALALARLGKNTPAQALATGVANTELRHAAYAELQRTLGAHAAGPDATPARSP